jgi:ABC-type transporter Mla subunit MlaD
VVSRTTRRWPLLAIGIVALAVCMALALVAVVRGPGTVATPAIVASVDQGVAHAGELGADQNVRYRPFIGWFSPSR